MKGVEGFEDVDDVDVSSLNPFNTLNIFPLDTSPTLSYNAPELADRPFLNTMTLKQRVIDNPLFRYVRESKEELEKVAWPTRKTTHLYALMVVAVSVLMGVFFFVLDWVFSRGLNLLVNLSA